MTLEQTNNKNRIIENRICFARLVAAEKFQAILNSQTM